MSRHLTVATAIEKNRIASDKAFIVLAEISVLNGLGDVVEILRLARNSEGILFKSNPHEEPHLFEPANFSIDLSSDLDREPTLAIEAEDPTGAIRERMDRYDGGIRFPVRIIIVNTGNLDAPPELEEVFEVVGSSVNGYKISFDLGVDSPLSQRFPLLQQNRDQCTVDYKGPLCKYAGPMASCDYTRFGANGCKAHGNSVNFGGFPGLQNLLV